MTLYLTQMNMSRGEMSPRARARMDVDMYQAGMAELVNFIVMKQGGITRRPGTEYIADGRGVSPIRLIPFVFGVLDTGPQSYILELSDLRFRIYTINGRVESGGSPVTIVCPWPSSAVFDLDYVQSADVLYVSHPDYRTQKITRTSDTSWTCTDYEEEDGPYLPGDSGLNTYLTFSGTNDLADKAGAAFSNSVAVSGSAASVFDSSLNTYIRFDHLGTPNVTIDFSGTDAYTCTGYSMVARISSTFSGPAKWIFEGYDGTNWITLDNQTKLEGWQAQEKQYYPIVNRNAYQQYRVVFSGSDGNGSAEPDFTIISLELAQDPDEAAAITVTASSLVDINDGAGFTSDDIGRVFRVRGDDGFWRWCRIESITSTSVVEVKMNGPALASAQSIVRWEMGAWSPGTGWPAKIAFYEERLFFGKNHNNPQRLWSSKTADYTDHGKSSPLVEDDALELEMIGGEVNSIQFLAENQDLIVGTTKTIRAITVANTQQGFSATNAKQQRQVSVGAAPIRPVSTGQVLLFVDYYKKSIRELTFSFESNSYVAPELTILAEHLFKDMIVDMAFSQEPVPVLWVVLENGEMVSITYDRDQRIIACTQCVLGGEDAAVESVATIPGTDRDEVWIAVRRSVLGTTQRRVERFYKMFDNEERDMFEARFMDSHLIYEGEPSNSFTGLIHLAGQKVIVNADGFEYRDLTVAANGVLLLPQDVEARRMVVGLQYVSIARQLYPSQGLIDGSRIGRKWKVMRVVLDVVASLGLKYGTDRKMRDVFKRLTSDGDPTEQMELRYGKFGSFGDSSWKEDDTLVIANDTPFPSTILSITVGIEGEP